MTQARAADRVAAHFARSRFLRSYVYWKVRTDPVCEAVAQRLRDHRVPLLEIGCGFGLIAFYLRERGVLLPIRGIDHDPRKIAAAQQAAAAYENVEFELADARLPIPRGRTVLLLDVLHYLREEEQSAMLREVADAVPADGIVMIRDCVRDGSWRYALTYLEELFARATGWLRAERLSFPTREQIVQPFRDRGYAVDVRPFRGKTPYNNYLFTFSRASSGTTNE